MVPEALFSPPRNASQWFVSSTGSLRYDLYAGNVTVDDVDMALPFSDTLYVAQRVTGATLAKALSILRDGANAAVEEGAASPTGRWWGAWLL